MKPDKQPLDEDIEEGIRELAWEAVVGQTLKEVTLFNKSNDHRTFEELLPILEDEPTHYEELLELFGPDGKAFLDLLIEGYEIQECRELLGVNKYWCDKKLRQVRDLRELNKIMNKLSDAAEESQL